ncbi:MotA/TolQ/ExbB proton channel family protein [Candidatus Sumerlaeota bacterium]|nr:MotA/TolQ/ExbB proton channel family protein [Candidatus Sumerlaeota bacterium]
MEWPSLLAPVSQVVTIVSWPFAAAVVALSIYGLAVVIGWWRDIRRLRHPRGLVESIDRALEERSLERLGRIANHSRSLLGDYVSRWLYRLERRSPSGDFDCESEMRRLLPLVEASDKLRVLIAGNAVSLGMLFSVIGILSVFHSQADPSATAGDPRQVILGMLSGGLGLALVTTAVGLTMAVVHLSLGHIMRTRTWRIVADLRAVQARLRQVHSDLIADTAQRAA